MVYNYWYSTDRLNDRNGNKVNSVTVGPAPGVTLGVDVNVDVYAVSPMFIWVSDWKFLGAKYAAYIAPSFSDASVGASLSTTTGSGRSGNFSSEFGVGDLFVQRSGSAGRARTGTSRSATASTPPSVDTTPKR